MAQKIFINFPVNDLEISKKFYTALGYSINPIFTNDMAACVVVSDIIHIMLLTKPFFSTFTQKQIVDATSSAEVLVCLSANSRGEVDTLVDKALAAGGKIERPINDHSFMYERSFNDPDGHVWEIMFLDESAYQKTLSENT